MACAKYGRRPGTFDEKMKKSEVSSRNAQKTMRPEDNAAIKKKLAPSTLNTFPVTPKTVPLSLPTSKSVPTSIARPSTQAKSRLYAPRTPLQSPSTHKPPPSSSSSIKPPSSTSMKPPVSTAPAGRSVAQRAGTASARSAATLLSLQKEMEKYKKLSESQKKQIAIAKKQMSKTCLIFDGMSCVVRHLTENLTAFETPSLRREIESADQKYDEYEHQLQERQNTIDNLYAFQLELQDDIKRWIVELEREKQRHGKEKDKLLEMFECEKEALGQQHAFLMQGEEEKQFELKKRINELKVELEGKNKEIERFEAKVIELEDTLSGGKDKRLRALNEKIKYLSEEVNSLKAVLEIKDEEIRNLSQKLRIQEQQNEELPMLQQTIIVLNQRLEQLEISTNSKNETLARLTAENESLKQQFELEARLRRRISMKNEELEFALSESVCGSFETPCKMHKSFTGAIESTPSRPIARGSFLLDSSMDTDSEVFLQSHKRFRSFERIEETGKSDESSSPSTSTWNTTVYSVVEVSKDAGQIEENGYEEKKVSLDSNIPKCILDSGFEDINGLTSNTNSK